MQYLISFLEGIITFISPCLLPMIPIYISYFAGGGEKGSARTVKCALGFVCGFTMVFVAMGALAGTVGRLLMYGRPVFQVICGAVVVVFGLNYMGVLNLNIFKGAQRQADVSDLGFFSSMVFGMVFSIGWTPCVGAFLGSALLLASQQETMLKGVLLLLVYSAGLGVPFIVSALLIDRLKNVFNAIKRHYKTVNTVCGAFLVVTGILMASGLLGRWLTLLS